MNTCMKCEHKNVCEWCINDSEYDFPTCSDFLEEIPQGELAERALDIIDRLRTDGHINNKEQGSLRRAILLPERPQGEWIKEEDTGLVGCSNCHIVWLRGITKFCPNCGADMRGDDT